MKQFIPFLLISMLLGCQQKKETFAPANSFQLSPPLGTIDSALFKNTAQISLKFAYPDAEIRYTTDGSEVTSNSLRYDQTLSVTKSTHLKARAFHPEFSPSTEIELQVAQIKKDISTATITITPEAHSNYAGQGSTSLIDLQKGTLQFRAGKKWLGFQSKVVTVHLKLTKETEISKVLLSVLINQSGWIFSPSTISVFSEDEEIGSTQLEHITEQQENQLKYIEIPIRPGGYSTLKIQIIALDEIPEWHQGKGTPPWLFIDELLLE